MSQNIDEMIRKEMRNAVTKFPLWPTDAAHALSIVGEEFGELAREVNQLCYEFQNADSQAQKEKVERARAEAVQVVVTAIRLLAGFDEYVWRPADQVVQTTQT